MSPSRSFTSRATRAFTLIEILVVMGIMAVVATIVGVGLSRGGEGAALTAGQSLLVSQLNAARAQAALGASRSALVVAADASDLTRDHRFLVVAIEAAGIWRAVSDGTTLPNSVLVRGLAEGSTLLSQTLAVALDPGDTTTTCSAVIFEAEGRISTAGGGAIWLSVGIRDEDGWSFSPDAPSRGISMSRYGAITPLDDWEGVF